MKAVNLVNELKIPVYRVGYYRVPWLKKTISRGYNCFGSCWYGLIASLQDYINNSYIVPIMDGFDPRITDSFCSMIQDWNNARSIGHGKALCVKNSQNIIGETFFADSKYSLGTQLVDILSYLRNVNDLREEGRKFNSFKKKFIPINEKLTKIMKLDTVIEFNKKVVDRITGNVEMVTKNYQHPVFLTRIGV